MIEKLNVLAAIALRDAIEAAISHNETAIKQKPLDGLRPDAEKYFASQHAERVEAIAQLKALRKIAHGRVFDAQK